jgi:ADP-L-glycero-D-manno-heptose 6-epimerase
MTLFLAMDTLQGGIFNAGRGEANTWLDLINPVFEAMGKEPNIEFVPLPDPLKDAYQYYTCADTGKLNEAGFDRPIIPLKEAVTDYVQNYLMTGEYLGEE